MRRLIGLALIVAAGAGACKTIREELPTQPESSDPDAVANGPLIPAAPTSTPTPDPVQSEPLPEPPGSDDGGGDGGSAAYCGDPAPPPISQVNLRVHTRQTTRSILDSSPVVGPDVGYCRQIGYTDGRSYCPVRPPGHPERSACEAASVGSAADTGRPGPTWSADGRGCGRATSGAYCLNHPDNQYLVYAYGSGTFSACVANGACGKIRLP
jgi:hypothetical protein